MEDLCYHVWAQMRPEVLTRFATKWLFHLLAEMGSGISKTPKLAAFPC